MTPKPDRTPGWQSIDADEPPRESVVGEAAMGRFLAKPGYLLARVDQISTALFGEPVPGVTLSQAELLLLLDALGTMPQIELSRAAGLDKSTIAYILDNLAARSWIERSPDRNDRRRALVTLTSLSAEAMPVIARSYAGMQADLLAPLPTGDVPALLALLRSIGSNPAGPAPLWQPAAAGAAGSLVQEAPSFLFRRALQLFHAQFIACTGSLNLTPRQFSLLFILHVQPTITQAGFARLFGLDPSTCGVIMRNLASRNLIASVVDPNDRRARSYSITEAGRVMLFEAQPMTEESERLAFRGAGASDVRRLVRQLRAIARAHSHRLRFPGPVAPC